MPSSSHVNPLLIASTRQNRHVDLVSSDSNLPDPIDLGSPVVNPIAVNPINSGTPVHQNQANVEADEADDKFKFNFEFDFYVPSKEEKSGYMRISDKECKVDWNTTVFDLAKIKSSCVDSAKSKATRTLLEDSTRQKKNPGRWTLYIANSTNFPKTVRNRVDLTADNIQTWVEEAHSSRDAGLSYVAQNPQKLKAQAILAERTEAAAASAARKMERRTKDSDDDEESDTGKSEVSVASDEAPESRFIGLLFKKYPMNIAYHATYPPIIDPKCSDRYFALTYGKAEEWAKNWHEDDVGLDKPPASLKYDLLKSARKSTRASPPPSASQPAISSAMIAELVVGVVTAVEAARSPLKRPAPDLDLPRTSCSTPIRSPRQDTSGTSPPLSSSPPYAHNPADPDGIDPYLHFCRFPADQILKLGKVLKSAGITDYRMINKDELPRGDLASDGVSNAHITMLYASAKKYRSYRTQQRKVRHTHWGQQASTSNPFL